MFCGDFRATYLETSVFEPLPGISADSVATAAHTGFYTDVFTEAMAGNGAGATLQTWFLTQVLEVLADVGPSGLLYMWWEEARHLLWLLNAATSGWVPV